VIGVAASSIALGDILTIAQLLSLGLVVAGIILANKD
jgi:drug/metabolite transporter (DMT)-like permease